MGWRKTKELVPFGLVIGGLLYTLMAIVTGNASLTYRHIGAYMLTITVLVSAYFFKKRLSLIIFGITLTLGTLNLISFIPYELAIGLGMGETKLEIQVFSFVTFLILLLNYRKPIMHWVNKDGI